MRPRTFDEFVGQEELLAPGKPLREAIERDLLQSIILWGPPGTGKTTLARIIADTTKARFVSFSAVLAGHQGNPRGHGRGRAPPAVDRPPHDRVHRRDPPLQQGAAGRVPAARRGRRHRAHRRDHREPVVRGQRRAAVALEGVRAARPDRRGGRGDPARARSPTPSAASAREPVDDRRRTRCARSRSTPTATRASALNLLELSVAAAPIVDGARRVDIARVEQTIQRRALLYDKSGEEHYNLISALHKSMRNSDPDAAVYWLARMVEAGEDPLYIARRLVRFASEDIGNADPQALTVAVAAKDAVHFIGMPEGNTALAQAALYLATAPKSNAVYEAYSRAAEDAHRDVAAAGAAAPAQRADQADEGARLRQGLPVRAQRGRRHRRHVVPAAARSKGGSTTSRRSAGSRRKSSGGSTAGRRSRKTAEASPAPSESCLAPSRRASGVDRFERQRRERVVSCSLSPRQRCRSIASGSRAGKLLSARTLPLPRRLRGFPVDGYPRNWASGCPDPADHAWMKAPRALAASNFRLRSASARSQSAFDRHR